VAGKSDFRSREMLMRSAELQRNKRLLLSSRDEVTATGDATTLVPPADEAEGDVMERASADVEGQLQIHLNATNGRLLEAIEDALARIAKQMAR
jgi:RNA polymerase-binding transcription factor DksA